MIAGRAIAGGMVVALAAAALSVAPAIGASEAAQRAARLRSAAAPAPTRFVGSFTPAAADPRLAAVFARGGLGDDASDFRFTPSEARQGNRAVTVAVRARSARIGQDGTRFAATAPTVGLAPIAYSLGVAVGWQRFAISGDLARIDLAGQPGSRESTDVAVSYALNNRLTGRVKASSDHALAGAAKIVDPDSTYAVDVGGSYSLTRNIDLTAGVRYRTDRERLTQFADDRRDSQAVYVGTAFRF